MGEPVLVGFYFDWFVVFSGGAIWAYLLGLRAGVSPWVGRWGWIVGIGYLIGWGIGAYSMTLVLDPASGADGVKSANQLLQLSRMATQGVVGGGLVWLVVLTAGAFSAPSEGAQGSAD